MFGLGTLGRILLSSSVATTVASSGVSPIFLGYTGYKLYKERKEREKKEWIEYGFKKGARSGNIKTAKKFADMLEVSDSNKVATFALGVCVSNLDGIDEEEIEVIKKKLGDPNSNLIAPPLRKKYMAIYDECPGFEIVKTKYLKKINKEFLKELNDYVHEIIISDKVISGSEKDFLENEWYPYLESRKIEFERFEFVIKKTTKRSNVKQKEPVKASEVEKEKKDSASVAKTTKSKPVKKTAKPKAETVAKVTKSKAVAKKATAKKQDVKLEAAKKAVKAPAGKAKPATKTAKASGKTLTALTKAIVSKPKRTVKK